MLFIIRIIKLEYPVYFNYDDDDDEKLMQIKEAFIDIIDKNKLDKLCYGNIRNIDKIDIINYKDIKDGKTKYDDYKEHEKRKIIKVCRIIKYTLKRKA